MRDNEGCRDLFLGLLAIPVSMAANGAVLVKLWTWFVTPVFDVPQPSIPEALGIAVVSAMLTHQTTSKPDLGENIPLWAQAWILAITKPLTYLTVGWIYSLFI